MSRSVASGTPSAVVGSGFLVVADWWSVVGRSASSVPFFLRKREREREREREKTTIVLHFIGFFFFYDAVTELFLFVCDWVVGPLPV